MITKDYTVIGPAYGRDYKNKASVEADFRLGKDFTMMTPGFSGTYCSIGDFNTGTKVNIRYARLTKVHSVVV